MAKRNIMLEKSFSFAISMIRVYLELKSDKGEYILGKQLMRSGTSIGAMVREAQNAESRSDFEHKLAIAQKECAETLYWLELLFESGYLPESDFENYHKGADELFRLLRSSILTSKSKSRK